MTFWGPETSHKVFASLLCGVAGLGDIRKLGRLGGKTLGYFLLTTTVAISIGLAFANIIRPGDFIAQEDKKALLAQYEADATRKTQAAADKPSTVDTLLDNRYVGQAINMSY